MLSERKTELAIFVLVIMPTIAFAQGATSVMVPTLGAPIPDCEYTLQGDVERLEHTVEAPNTNASQDVNRVVTNVWEKIELNGTVPQWGKTFLAPQDCAHTKTENYFISTDGSGVKTLWIPVMYFRNDNSSVLNGYDFHGRLREIRLFSPFGLLFTFLNDTPSSFRYEFLYDGENEMDCSEAALFFSRKDAEECEVGRVALRYEAGRLVEFLSDGDGYFWSEEKEELKYDDQGFPTVRTKFVEGAANPLYTVYYRNYEHDHMGNWTRRDVYRDELFLCTEKRKIDYTNENE